MDAANSEDLQQWTVMQLKNYLKERKIKIGSANKAELVRLVSHCIDSNVPVKDQNSCVDITIHNKLYVENGLVRLPNPDTLQDWENGVSSVPDISSGVVEKFFADMNSKIGISTNGGHSLALGKGLSLSGHVLNVQYHGISPNIGYCFIKADVRRQVHHSEHPYSVWAILRKDRGQPQSLYCQCPGGYVFTCILM